MIVHHKWCTHTHISSHASSLFCFGFEFDYSSQNFRGSRIWIDDTRLSFSRGFVSGSQIRDSSNRQPLRQVLQKDRYTVVNHTRDIFFVSLSYTWTTEE